MGKRKNPKKKKVNNSTVEIEKIDKEVLAQAIVEAYQIIERKKKAEEQIAEEREQKEWYAIIGQNEYQESEKQYLKKLHKLRNDLVAFWKLLFFKPENVRDMRATFSLIKLAVIGILALSKWGLYLLSGFAVYSIFAQSADWLSTLCIAFAIWLIARIFRIAAFEIEKVKDGNLLLDIFSGSLSFVAVVIAIIALVIDGT